MRKVIWSTFNWTIEHFNPSDLMESQVQLTHFTRERVAQTWRFKYSSRTINTPLFQSKPLFILTLVCNIQFFGL